MNNTFIITFLLAFQTIYISSNAQYFDWVSKTGGYEGISVATDNQGSVYTCGHFTGTSDFDPGPNTNNMTANGPSCIYITKNDSLGNFIWAKQFGYSFEDKVCDMTIDNNGYIYITGYFNSPSVNFSTNGSSYLLNNEGGSDLFISKLNNNGNLVWAKSIGSSYSTGKVMGLSIDVDINGDLAIGGWYTDIINFSTNPNIYSSLPHNGPDWNGFVLKLTSNGNFQWVKGVLGSSGGSIVQAVKFGPSSTIYYTGSMRGVTEFDPNNIMTVTGGGNDLDGYIAKLNSQGDYYWVKALALSGNCIGKFIEVDHQGNSYIAGNFSGVVDFDPSPITNVYSTQPYISDIFVMKLDNDGNLGWANQIGGNAEDVSTGISLDMTGNLYLSGMYTDTININFPPYEESYISNGLTDNLILKFKTNGEFVWIKTFGNEEIDRIWDIKALANESLYSTGTFSSTLDFDPSEATYYMTTLPINSYNSYLLKLGKNGSFASHIENEDEMNLLLYPNPCYEKVFLRLNNSSPISKVKIYNSTGHILREYNNISNPIISLDISIFKPGVYFIHVANDVNIYKLSFIKQ